MTWAPVHTFNVACGAAGAFVDVTSQVYWDQGGVVRSWGRQSSFNDFTGATFSFTLDNRDGRFTPDNTNPGATPLCEGQLVTWQTDSRLISGRIAVGGGLQLIFPDPGQPNSARIRVTCGDMLVYASRNTMQFGLAYSVVMAALRSTSAPSAFYPLNDAAGSLSAAEQSGSGGAPLTANANGRYSFGAAGAAPVGGTQLSFDTVATARSMSDNGYATGFIGASAYLSAWVTPATNTTGAYLSRQYPSATVTVAPSAAGLWTLTDGTNTVSGPPVLSGLPTFVQVAVTESGPITAVNITCTLYVNGVTYGSTSSVSAGSLFHKQAPVDSIGLSTFPDSAQFSHFLVAPIRVREDLAQTNLESVRLALIASATPDVTLATLPTNLSTTPIGYPDVTGQSVLDAFNDVIRTEQGQLFTQTTGTGTAPVQTVNVRARDRPATVTATWTAANEIRPDANIVRDLSNTVSQVTVSGAGVTATVTDAPLAVKVGGANTTFSVLNSQYADAYTAGTDRINRGRKIGLDVASFRVDGISGTNTDRSADLLALTLGDRHRVAGLPTAQLGYSTWDGFLLGVSETWTPRTADFVMYLEATGAPTAVYDTGSTDGNRYMAGGDLSLSASITNSATSMSVASTGALLSTTEAPYTMLIDSEQVTVTAVTGATPQVATITRGVNGTTAAAHSSGALLDMATAALYAY